MIETVQHLDTWLFRLGNISAANPLFDTIMPVITSNSYIVPVLLAYIVAIIWRGNVRDQICVLLGILTFLAADQSVVLLKQVFMRSRPCFVLTDVHLLVTCSSSASFPSGHAANHAAIAILIALCYRGWSWVLLFWVIIAAYSRVYCGVHYPADVICGIALGGFIAWLVFTLYQRLVVGLQHFRF